jgi:hypothetical protein
MQGASMNRSTASPHRLASLACLFVVALAAATSALADPPTRAARISYVSANASFSPAGSDAWLQARVNRPVWVGDRLWSGDGRIELQVGGASLRLAPGTTLQVLNFDDRIAQFEVTQGTVALHVRTIDRNETIEIDTPTFAFVTREEGDYRIDVERDRTAVSTRRGLADIYGQDVAYRIDRREQFAFYSPDLRDYDVDRIPPPDPFDRWARERAQREDRSLSARYVSPELVGFVDLDSHGEWRSHADYGNVWIPRVEANWAPYRYGHWSWIDPWGWTWIDDAPWGFAPTHYGRWTRIDRSWAWVPGPRDVTPVYAPALVAWFGGDNFSLTVSSGRTRGIGWFPLAPGEIWRPTYDVSREYFTRVNVSNTVVNQTTVVNVYNNRREPQQVDYRFRSAPQAVTAVPVETFVQSRPVQATHAQIAANAAAQANVLVAPTVQPNVQSIVGGAQRAQARPPAETLRRPVVARTAPAAVPSIEQRAAQAREGKPAQAAPSAVPPAAQSASPAPSGSVAPGQLRSNVRVVDTDKAAPKPIPAAPAARTEDKGRQPEGRASDDKGRGGENRAGPARDRSDDRQPAEGRAAPASPTAAPAAEPERAPGSRAPVAPAPAPRTGGPDPRPAAAPPAPTPSPSGVKPIPPSAPPAPAGRTPDAQPPDVEQLRGREPGARGRGPEGPDGNAKANARERSESPAVERAAPRPTAPAAAPAAPAPRSAETAPAARPAPAAVPATPAQRSAEPAPAARPAPAAPAAKGGSADAGPRAAPPATRAAAPEAQPPKPAPAAAQPKAPAQAASPGGESRGQGRGRTDDARGQERSDDRDDRGKGKGRDKDDK